MTKMRAEIFQVKRFAVHDGDGIRTTVFFKGCPLRCVWCHNPEGLSGKTQLGFFAHKCLSCGICVGACPRGAHRTEEGRHVFDREKCIACGACAAACPAEALTLYGRGVTLEELLSLLLEDREFYEASGGGVTLSGGECLLQAAFCRELLSRLKAEGIGTAVDTSGCVPRAAIEEVTPFTDTFLYDLKAMSEKTHLALTGRDNGEILDNLRYLDAIGARVEVRIPFAPALNGGEIEKIARFLGTLSCVCAVRVLPYHAGAASKYGALGMEYAVSALPPTEEELLWAEETVRRLSGIPCRR